MTPDEIKLEIVQEAQDHLHIVKDKMLDLSLMGELESKDFEIIHALAKQLNQLCEKYVPEYKPLSLEGLFDEENNGENQ